MKVFTIKLKDFDNPYDLTHAVAIVAETESQALDIVMATTAKECGNSCHWRLDNLEVAEVDLTVAGVFLQHDN